MMQATALEKIKKGADEKLHRLVRGNHTSMMIETSQDPSYRVPAIKMARNGTSSFELDENPPIIENGDSENHQGLEENIQTDNGCPEANSGLEEIHERTSTAAQNESIGLVENPNNLENVLNVDGRVSDRCCVINIPHTTLFPDKKVNNICYDMSQTNFIMKKDSDEFQKLMKEWKR